MIYCLTGKIVKKSLNAVVLSCGGVGRQHDLRMDNAAFPGVVVGHSVPFICQLGSAAVSSCGNGRTACAALDDTDGDMTEVYGEHLLSVRG